MRKATLALAAGLFVAILSTSSIPAALAEDTVTLPCKSRCPTAGRVLELREVFRISDGQGGFFFKSPENLQPAPDGGLIVVDEGQLLRFDASGKFVVNMFRMGQGPGELERIENYVIWGGNILAFQRNPMKCVVTRLDGTFVREFKPDAPVFRLLGRYSDRLLAAMSSRIPVDKVQKPEGEMLDINWTLQLMGDDGRVETTPLAYPTKFFAKRLPNALIADNVTFLLTAPVDDKLIAVANEDGYAIHIADPERNVALRTIRRDYRRVKYEPEKAPDSDPGSRRLAPPRDYFNDIQRLFAVDGSIWVVTSTLEPGKGVLVDVVSPAGENLDSFYLPLPKGVGLHALARYPLTIFGRTVLVVEPREDGQLQIVKYEIVG